MRKEEQERKTMRTPCETNRRVCDDPRAPQTPSRAVSTCLSPPLFASYSAVPRMEPSKSPEAPSRTDIPGGLHLCGSVLVSRLRVRSISRLCSALSLSQRPPLLLPSRQGDAVSVRRRATKTGWGADYFRWGTFQIKRPPEPLRRRLWRELTRV